MFCIRLSDCHKKQMQFFELTTYENLQTRKHLTCTPQLAHPSMTAQFYLLSQTAFNFGEVSVLVMSNTRFLENLLLICFKFKALRKQSGA